MRSLGVYEFVVLALLLVSFAVIRPSGNHRLVFWSLVVAGLFLASGVLKRYRLRDHPEVSDDEFLRLYDERFTTPRTEVIEKRNEIAKILGLPAGKLSPDDRIGDLAWRAGFFGSDSVALGDLDEKLAAMSKQAGLESPASRTMTVAEFISQTSAARR